MCQMSSAPNYVPKVAPQDLLLDQRWGEKIKSSMTSVSSKWSQLQGKIKSLVLKKLSLRIFLDVQG